MTVQERVPLAPRLTLGVGGPARWLVEARTEEDVRAARDWARRRATPVRVLGGGSNLVVADAGIEALVVAMGLRGVTTRAVDGAVEVTAAAGEPWDALVATTVARGWAGLECLSGIPGLVGATPMQNVGAYGQEVSDTVVAVRALDLERGEVVAVAARDCGFAYRDSRFRSGEPGRWAILAVTYRLRPGGRPTVDYADVERRLAARGIRAPTLGDVRESVLAIRRAKSMTLDQPDDPNRRSCGSFFLNPIVSAAEAERVRARADDPAMPSWRQADGRVKLSAAWLIERTGFARGERAGHVGLSTRHTLAVVAHEGASARDVLEFAHRLEAAVEARFGVRLHREPVLWV